ncbi:mitochondrial carrier [Ramicandelaber brevisporus]|nr:mitochondrial carrier [Ramicandelaber brevisporus]
MAPVVSKEAALPPFGHAFAGAIGAVLALAITYPADTIKTRMQVQATPSAKGDKPARDLTSYNGVFDAAKKILRHEGITGFYAGLTAGLIGQASINFSYFYFTSFLKSRYLRYLASKNGAVGNAVKLSVAAELILGMLAGALAQIFTIPVSVVATRQQTTVTPSRSGLMDTVREIVAEDGWTGLWTGLRPSLVLTINPTITYGFFEQFKTAYLNAKQKTSLSALEVFIIGALTKSIATVVTYPYIMAKVRLQWKPTEADIARYGDMVKYDGAVDVLRKVWKLSGPLGWYKGMQTQIFKAVLTQALLLVLKDKMTAITVVLFSALGLLEKTQAR